MIQLPRPLRAVGAAAALYLSLYVASLWPQSVRPLDRIGYVGDSLESVYLLAWNVGQSFRDPLRLFHANDFYPVTNALTFTDHRLFPSLIVAPVIWATHNAVLACNVSVALACLLAAFGARRLAQVLGADAIGAWAAGALFAFNTYQVNEAPRLQIIWDGFVPLAVAELVNFLRTGNRRSAWLVALFSLLQGLCANYHLLYTAFILALIVAMALVARPRETLERLSGIVAPTIVAAVLFSPIAWAYVRSTGEHDYTRDLPRGIALEHYFTTSPTNVLYGPLGTEFHLQQQGPHFVGFVSLGLAVLALLWWRRDADDASARSVVPARFWVPCAAALAVLLALMAMGRDIEAFGHIFAPGPYALAYAWIPGFKLVRIPERLALYAMLFVSLLVARALMLIGTRSQAVALCLAALVPLEHVSPLVSPIETPVQEIPRTEQIPVGSSVPQVYRWLAGDTANAIAELPIHGSPATASRPDRSGSTESQPKWNWMTRKETLEMYFSTFHWKPIIHGYARIMPPVTKELRMMAAQLPGDLESLAGLQAKGVDTLVVHFPSDGTLAVYASMPADRRRAFARHFSLEPLKFYLGWSDLEQSGRVVRIAEFHAPTAPVRVSGGSDVVYRIAGAP